MSCEECGKSIVSTWVHKRPIAYASYATAKGVVALCSLPCEQKWIDLKGQRANGS